MYLLAHLHLDDLLTILQQRTTLRYRIVMSNFPGSCKLIHWLVRRILWSFIRQTHIPLDGDVGRIRRMLLDGVESVCPEQLDGTSSNSPMSRQRHSTRRYCHSSCHYASCGPGPMELASVSSSGICNGGVAPGSCYYYVDVPLDVDT